MKKVLNVCQSVSPAFFPFFNCADPDPYSEYRSQSTASLLQISNWFIPGHCCIKVTLHMFCYLRILFWLYWQDESGPQMCGSLFPFREDIFWQRQQWPIVITMNTGPVVTLSPPGITRGGFPLGMPSLPREGSRGDPARNLLYQKLYAT